VVRILDFRHNLLDGVHLNLSGHLVEMRLKIFCGLVILARRHQDGIFDSRHDNLRVDAFLAA